MHRSIDLVARRSDSPSSGQACATSSSTNVKLSISPRAIQTIRSRSAYGRRSNFVDYIQVTSCFAKHSYRQRLHSECAIVYSSIDKALQSQQLVLPDQLRLHTKPDLLGLSYACYFGPCAEDSPRPFTARLFTPRRFLHRPFTSVLCSTIWLLKPSCLPVGKTTRASGYLLTKPCRQ